MHIKSNIEHIVIDVIIVAICPLVLIMNDAKTALYYVAATAICLLVSAILCLMLNKYLSKIMKVFITTVLSSFLITVFNYVIKEYGFLGLEATDKNYYAILSTIVLSIDIYYIEIKAAVNHYFARVLNSIFVFALITMIYIVIKEFLSVGTIFEWKPFKYSGFEFFNTYTFSFILLAMLAAFSSMTFRAINKHLQEKSMAYAKLLKQIKNERIFQYDSLRRQKLLTSEVEIKYVDGDEYEEIKDKDNKNESLADLVSDEDGEEKERHTEGTIKKRKSKLKVSKEAKVQHMFERSTKGGKK
ncbi:MAG: hypothetical protein IKD36_01035 [Clostridia bacterium]|nr:hypothetical protein [Clostridia bacterium]